MSTPFASSASARPASRSARRSPSSAASSRARPPMWATADRFSPEKLQAAMSEETAYRVLILAPVGRDAATTAELLARANLYPHVCKDLDALVEALQREAAATFVAEEALFGRDLGALTLWVAAQPAWSDPPFVILTSHHQDRRVA